MKIKLSDHFGYKRLIRFVIPSIIMMVFTSVYFVVDGLFVSNFVGKTAFAAVNLVMPVANIMSGVGFMLGTGGSALVAKTLGEGNKELAERYFTMIIKATLVTGLILSAVGAISIRPISILLGATDEMLPYCISYGSLLLGLNFTYMLQNAFQAFFITAEKPKLGLYTTVAAGLTNMALDALFVAVFGWGEIGAGLATGLSPLVGTVIPLIYFIRPNTALISLRKTKTKLRPVLRSCANGASEMVSCTTSAIVGVVYNYQLLRFAGENGVATYGVLMYLMFIFIGVFIGYAMGSAPVISYHFGAENHSELKNLLRKSTALTFSAGLAMSVAAELLAVPLAQAFVGYNRELFDMTVRALRITVAVFTVMGFNIFSSSFFTALNDGGISACISFLRVFIFKFAAVIFLPMVFGLDGIWFAEAAAELFSLLISVIFIFAKRKKYHYM